MTKKVVNLSHSKETKNLKPKQMELITIYKGVEIFKSNASFIFFFNGIEHVNTNLHFTKILINRNIKK